MSTWAHHFSNFGRLPVYNDLIKRLGPRGYLVLEKKSFEGFYHIWAWQPSWSMDCDHLSNHSFSYPKEAPLDIRAALASEEKLFEILNIFPIQMWGQYECIEKQT